MAKLRVNKIERDGVNRELHMYWCDGCGAAHSVIIAADQKSGGWTFNGDYEKPTYFPSQLSNTGKTVCHTYITDGQVKFLEDSSHELAGKTVPLPDLPDWLDRERQEDAKE